MLSCTKRLKKQETKGIPENFVKHTPEARRNINGGSATKSQTQVLFLKKYSQKRHGFTY